jgi:lipoyl(octanoyl) transferase
MLPCEVSDLGRIGWARAFDSQRELAEQRKRGAIPDQLLFAEHDPVITLGRNAQETNVLASLRELDRAGIEIVETNRGGDVTFHGPGQIVGYPILDLKDWKRDVHAYVRAIEECVIGALGEFGIRGLRSEINSGVWVEAGGELAKICAVGIHISRWVTMHGFALNVSTDLRYFRYINPCGVGRPVTSMAALGVDAGREVVIDALTRHFGQVFQREMKIFVLKERDS